MIQSHNGSEEHYCKRFFHPNEIDLFDIIWVTSRLTQFFVVDFFIHSSGTAHLLRACITAPVAGHGNNHFRHGMPINNQITTTVPNGNQSNSSYCPTSQPNEDDQRRQLV